MSTGEVVRRRRARLTWFCSGEFAHDKVIHPGDYYCEVTSFPDPTRDVALLRFCDDCGKTLYPKYAELALNHKMVKGQTALDFDLGGAADD